MSKKIIYADVREAEEFAKHLGEKYLRQNAWVATCETPGSYWCWIKTFPGYGRVMAMASQAVQMQADYDALHEEHAEEAR